MDSQKYTCSPIDQTIERNREHLGPFADFKFDGFDAIPEEIIAPLRLISMDHVANLYRVACLRIKQYAELDELIRKAAAQPGIECGVGFVDLTRIMTAIAGKPCTVLIQSIEDAKT